MPHRYMNFSVEPSFFSMLSIRFSEILSFLIQKFFDNLQRLSLCRFQIIIDDDTIKLGSKSHFVFRLCDAAFDNFGLIRAPTRQPATEFFDGGRLYKDGQCTVTVILFDVSSAYYIQVEYHVLTLLQLLFHLFFQRSVIPILVHFFVFQKLVVLNATTELFGSKEEIFDPVFLRPARWAAGCRNGERKI